MVWQLEQQYAGYREEALAPGAYGTGTNTVVVTQPTLTSLVPFKEVPVRTRCFSCNTDILTSTHAETGTLTWVLCLIIAFVGCWLGCCLIPFCVDSCKDVIHTCPNCRQMLGKYNRM